VRVRGKMQRISRLCGLISAAFLCASTSAAITTFTDGTFSNTNWSTTSLLTPTSAAGSVTSAGQIATGGDPGSYWQVDIQVNGGSNNHVYAFSLDNAAQWTPSTQGAITLFTYGEARSTTGAGQEFGPAILQDGTYYYSFAGSGATSGWQAFPTTTFTSTNFVSPTTSIHPNFTATGDPITFGFVSINNTTDTAFNTSADYDNWSVALTTTAVPEPTSMMLVLGGGALLLGRHRRPV
jgi:hypothetical protein